MGKTVSAFDSSASWVNVRRCEILIIHIIRHSSKHFLLLPFLLRRLSIFLKKMSATMVGRRKNFLGLLCPRRPYIELFCVEQKVKIIINNT